MPGRQSLPQTLKRSSQKAQDLFRKTLAAAEKQYGRGQRAGRTAYASLKRSFEKVGDRWVRKSEPGPSDERARRGGPPSKGGKSHGGVDTAATRQHLYDVAKELDIEGRSKMTKKQLVAAIEKENARQTARSRLH